MSDSQQIFISPKSLNKRVTRNKKQPRKYRLGIYVKGTLKVEEFFVVGHSTSIAEHSTEEVSVFNILDSKNKVVFSVPTYNLVHCYDVTSVSIISSIKEETSVLSPTNVFSLVPKISSKEGGNEA